MQGIFIERSPPMYLEKQVLHITFYEDFADRLKEWYDMGDEERQRCGKLGHEFVMSEDASMSATAMSNLFIEHMDTTFEKWTPRKRFTMFKA